MEEASHVHQRPTYTLRLVAYSPPHCRPQRRYIGAMTSPHISDPWDEDRSSEELLVDQVYAEFREREARTRARTLLAAVLVPLLLMGGVYAFIILVRSPALAPVVVWCLVVTVGTCAIGFVTSVFSFLAERYYRRELHEARPRLLRYEAEIVGLIKRYRRAV
jgi:hypothetical protein